MVRLPYGDGNDVIARCVLVAVRDGAVQRGAQEPIVCSERGCRAHRGKREAFDAAVQADSGLRDEAAAFRGRPEEDDEGYHEGLS